MPIVTGALGEGECSDQGQNTALQRQKLRADSGLLNTRASRLVLSVKLDTTI